MFERFSERARQVVVRAGVEARALGHNYVGTEHLLLGLFSAGYGPSLHVLDHFRVTRDQVHAGLVEIVGLGPLSDPDPGALAAIGIDLDAVLRWADETFGPGALAQAGASRPAKSRLLALGRRRRWRRRGCGQGGATAFTPRARRALKLSVREAEGLGRHDVAPEHLLLGLLRESEGIAAGLLGRAGLDYGTARRMILGNDVDSA